MKINLTKFFLVLSLSLLFVFSANGQTDNNSDKNENRKNTQQTDRPLKITNQPPPSFPHKCFEDKRNSYLKLRLKATFHSSGKITDIEIAESSGCEYFDKEGLRVAKKIKFKPAIKNGEPTTVSKIIEYGVGIS